MAKDEAWIGIEEAIVMIMKATGKTRRQAKMALVEACGSGMVRSSGLNTRTGERESIPPEAWPKIH